MKEAHAAFPPPPPRPFASKRNINALKAHQMALKWESFSDESFKYKWSSHVWYNNNICTGLSMELGLALSSAPFLLFSISHCIWLKCRGKFSLRAEGTRGWWKGVWSSFTVNTLWSEVTSLYWFYRCFLSLWALSISSAEKRDYPVRQSLRRQYSLGRLMYFSY